MRPGRSWTTARLGLQDGRFLHKLFSSMSRRVTLIMLSSRTACPAESALRPTRRESGADERMFGGSRHCICDVIRDGRTQVVSNLWPAARYHHSSRFKPRLVMYDMRTQRKRE